MNESKSGRVKGGRMKWERTVAGYHVLFDDGKYVALITPRAEIDLTTANGERKKRPACWELERLENPKDETLTFVGVYPTLKQAKKAYT